MPAPAYTAKTSLVKDRGVAQAVARHLGRRRKRAGLQVLRVQPSGKTVRALEKARPEFGRRSFLPKFATGQPIPIFVPITRPGGRERAADAMLFALEKQDRLLPLIRSTRSRSNVWRIDLRIWVGLRSKQFGSDGPIPQTVSAEFERMTSQTPNSPAAALEDVLRYA